MRGLIGLIFCAIALVVSAGSAMASGHRTPRTHHAPAPVTLHVTVGWQGQYSQSDWTPVRVSLQNRTGSDLSGTVEIPDNSNGNNYGPPLPYHSRYDRSVVLPAGGHKQVTLYMPGSDIGDEVDVRFQSGGRVLAKGSTFPTSFDNSSATIGVLATDPADAAWVRHVEYSGTFSNAVTVRLTPATVDPMSNALGTFDIIVLTDTDAASLDHAQLQTLGQYEQNGGSLVLVGGPSWQATLRPLPSSLLPGTLTGSRRVPDLSGLAALGDGSPPRHPTVVSVLSQPQGDVLASQSGTPLAVLEHRGNGRILYLGFDPAVAPVAGWHSAAALTASLLDRAAPNAFGRTAWPNGPPPSMLFMKFAGPGDIASELANVPAAALPSILLFVVLTAIFVVLLGPVNFLILRRLRRRELSWLTIPLGGLLCVAITFSTAFYLKGSTVLLNTVTVVPLYGNGGDPPATTYVGLFAPVRGDYQLTADRPGLAATLPQFMYYGPTPNQKPVGLHFQEGGQVGITFASMNMWSVRSAVIQSNIHLPGGIVAQLRLDAHGNIVGKVHNDTGLTLVQPVIFAGRAVVHLPDLKPEGFTRVRVRPSMDIFQQNYQPLWFKAYGQSNWNGGCWGGPGPMPVVGVSIGIGQGPMYCGGPTPPAEHSVLDRIRNVAPRLPDAQSISSLGEVTFAAWSEQPLNRLSVDGSTPQRRNLDLLMQPLSVRFPSGAFQLRPGTLGAELIEDHPEALSSGGCCPSPFATQPVYLGSGGWATFAFSMPSGRHVRFRHLTLWLNAGGADGSRLASVYDWSTRHWVSENTESGDAPLRDPNRFVSAAGTVLVKVVASDNSGSVNITDPHWNLQLSGDGVAS